eukprot:2576095-Prymnesium_polylepis.1
MVPVPLQGALPAAPWAGKESSMLQFLAAPLVFVGLSVLEQAIANAWRGAIADGVPSYIADAEAVLADLRVDEAWLRSAPDPDDVGLGHADIVERTMRTVAVLRDEARAAEEAAAEKAAAERAAADKAAAEKKAAE